jgi:hypothetical protein
VGHLLHTPGSAGVFDVSRRRALTPHYVIRWVSLMFSCNSLVNLNVRIETIDATAPRALSSSRRWLRLGRFLFKMGLFNF